MAEISERDRFYAIHPSTGQPVIVATLPSVQALETYWRGRYEQAQRDASAALDRFRAFGELNNHGAMVQRDGEIKFAVRWRGRCATVTREWEFEPLPSSRDDAFFERCRFTDWETAARIAQHMAREEGRRHDELRIERGLVPATEGDQHG